MIAGCLKWQESGLQRPPAVEKATANYFEEQDTFGRWLEEFCEIDPSAKCLEWYFATAMLDGPVDPLEDAQAPKRTFAIVVTPTASPHPQPRAALPELLQKFATVHASICNHFQSSATASTARHARPCARPHSPGGSRLQAEAGAELERTVRRRAVPIRLTSPFKVIGSASGLQSF